MPKVGDKTLAFWSIGLLTFWSSIDSFGIYSRKEVGDMASAKIKSEVCPTDMISSSCLISQTAIERDRKKYGMDWNVAGDFLIMTGVDQSSQHRRQDQKDRCDNILFTQFRLPFNKKVGNIRCRCLLEAVELMTKRLNILFQCLIFDFRQKSVVCGVGASNFFPRPVHGDPYAYNLPV